ncbi:MAG TPA: MBL fold metallo-hydrolase [Vicinamibacterales bacterium]|nr:MBL fold metallo-hydrolase [Vicinamibacterales bacterium]
MVTPLLIPAGNASEWTGPTGNNTWLLRGREPALIDAGTGRPRHIDAVARALADAPLVRVLMTHAHPDHAAGLPALRARWPDLVVIPPATEGDRVAAGDGYLEIVPTPGHAPDHVCFFDRESKDMFCGDLARLGGTIVIPAGRGGDMRAYLDSLRRVRDLRPRRLLPGHGPIVEDPAALIDEYLAHRAERERQIVAAMEQGARTVDEIVAKVYPDLPPALRGAAAQTIAAHLEALRSRF